MHVNTQVNLKGDQRDSGEEHIINPSPAYWNPRSRSGENSEEANLEEAHHQQDHREGGHVRTSFNPQQPGEEGQTASELAQVLQTLQLPEGHQRH